MLQARELRVRVWHSCVSVASAVGGLVSGRVLKASKSSICVDHGWMLSRWLMPAVVVGESIRMSVLCVVILHTEAPADSLTHHPPFS